MKLSCDVIRDLLPLYADRAASADTAALVEEHLASCPACREELRRLGAALPAEPEGAEPLRRFKRRWRRRQVLIAVTAVVATAAVAAGIFLTCFWGRRVAAGEVEVRMRVAATDPVTWETRPATAADFAQGACQYVVQFQLESGDPLRGRTERFVETDEDGTVTRAGLVVDLWEVLPVTSGSGNYGTGFTESVGTVSEDFDFVCIVRYRDGAVTYSAREMGLLDPAG